MPGARSDGLRKEFGERLEVKAIWPFVHSVIGTGFRIVATNGWFRVAPDGWPDEIIVPGDATVWVEKARKEADEKERQEEEKRLRQLTEEKEMKNRRAEAILQLSQTACK